MSAPENVNTRGLPAARQDAGNNPTETVFRRRRNGRDQVASSRDALRSGQATDTGPTPNRGVR